MSRASQSPLSPEMLRKIDAYWRAANYLRRSDLPVRQSVAETAAEAHAHQTAVAGSLGTTLV